MRIRHDQREIWKAFRVGAKVNMNVCEYMEVLAVRSESHFLNSESEWL